MLINEKSETGLSGFFVVFNGSTMNEKPGWYGLSHLMEHLICKSFDHLQNTYQQKNIQWNAYTSNTEVVFYMTGLDRHINTHKKDFLDLILSYEPTQEQLDTEKMIVLEEYKMSFNSQSESHYLNLQRKLYNYYGPIGLRSDIENFTLDDCKEYLNLYFKKPSKIINVSKFNDFNYDVELSPSKNYEPLKLSENKKLHIIKSDKKTKVPKGLIPLEIITKFKNKVSILDTTKIITEKAAYSKFLCNMLGSGLNSPLYQEIREKEGLAYSISCFVNKLNNKSYTITILTDTSNDNADKVQDRIQYIVENKEKFLTQDRFDIVKESYLTKIEESKILNHSNVGKFISEPDWIVENIINDITLEDVYKLIDEYLNWDDIYKSIDKTEFNDSTN